MIRITKHADYGILLLSHFAKVHGGRLYNARDLAEVSGLALPMVSKVLKQLVHAGLLTSQRGVKGGYHLARHPAEISVAEIIAALDGPIAVTECSGAVPSDCSIEHSCGVKMSWRRINEAIKEALDRVSLAEMTCPIVDPSVAFAGEPAMHSGHAV